MKVAAVLLAAGGSTRLGSPKQLLDHGGKPLLRRAAEAALAAGCQPVVAVLGAASERTGAALEGSGVRITLNPAWERGMGGSVRMGVETVAALAPEADGALVMLCDQPLVGPEALGRLLAAFGRAGSREALAAAAYQGTVGVPAVFGRAHFNALRHLPDDGGAKIHLMKHRSSLIEVPLPEAATDIDTREQYERFAETF